MPFRRANAVALRRIGGTVQITPPGGVVYECRGLFERPYQDGHSSAADVRRPEPTLQISDHETVSLEHGAKVEAWDREGVYIGEFQIQRAQPDDTGLMHITLRAARA